MTQLFICYAYQNSLFPNSVYIQKLHSLLTIQWIISWQNTDKMNPISENLLSLVNSYPSSLFNSYHAITPKPAHYFVASKKNSHINTLQSNNIHHAIELLRGILLINNVYRCLQIYISRNPLIEKHQFLFPSINLIRVRKCYLIYIHKDNLDVSFM